MYGNFLKKEKILNDLGIVKLDKELLEGEYATTLKCNFDKVKEVDYISGASMLIKRSVLEKLGMFNPKFFMYYEDMDLCFKFKKHGYKNFVHPSVKMVHIGGQSGYDNGMLNFRGTVIVLYSKYLFTRNILPIIASELVYIIFIIRYLVAYSILQLKCLLRKILSFMSFK